MARDLRICGALGGTRTPNLLIRSQMLYPLSYERWCPDSLWHAVPGLRTAVEALAICDAIQAAGHPLGSLNPALYLLRGSAAIRDVLPVNPAHPPVVIGSQPGLGDGDDYLTTLGEDQPPLQATRGYDDVTGLGTPGPSIVTAFTRFQH